MTFEQRLPVVVRDQLATASRGPRGTVSPPPAAIREAIAEAALTSGIATGPALAYTVKSLKHGLGYGGDRPVPPNLKPGETVYVEATIGRLLADLRATLDRDEVTTRLADHVRPNPQGYTNPTDVLPTSERAAITNLEARRAPLERGAGARRTCPTCRGRGRLYAAPCQPCGGTGTITAGGAA